jgi:aminopeptidase N
MLPHAAIQRYGFSESDDKEVNSFLQSKFVSYLKKPTSVHPDILLVTLKNAVWSDAQNYEKVKKLYLNSKTQEEQVKLLHALVCTKDIGKIKETLDFCLGPDVRFANVMVAVNAASKNPHGKEIVFRWVLDNWKEFGKRVGGHGGVLLRRFVKIVIPTCGIGHEDEVKEFIRKNKVAGLEKTFEQVWEELEINSAFVKSVLNAKHR